MDYSTGLRSANGTEAPQFKPALEPEVGLRSAVATKVASPMVVLEPDQSVILAAKMYVFDFDGTVVDSVEALHDGPEGRHARALQYVAEKYGAPFDRMSQWESTYRSCTGRGDPHDAFAIAAQYRQITGHEINAEEIAEASQHLPANAIVNKALMNKIPFVPGADHLMNVCHASGSMIAVCSASPFPVVHPALAFKDIDLYEKITPGGIVCSAEKKKGEKEYCGESAYKLAEKLGIPVEGCVGFGDSASDLCFPLGGYPLVIIRLEGLNGPNREAKLSKFREEVEAVEAKHPEIFDGRTKILLVADYSQVKIAPVRDKTAFRIVDSQTLHAAGVQ